MYVRMIGLINLCIAAELMGFDNPIPPLSNSTDEDILRGLNYASGGAGILDESEAFFVTTKSLSIYI